MRSIKFIAAAMALFCASEAAHAEGRPNILMILTDDQGWGDLSVNGNTQLSTPNIDSLARDGATFDRFYVSAVCSPTRGELLTGRYNVRLGIKSTSRGEERLELSETTIAETFKAAGYVTGCFGKWHNGMQWPYHPNARGFDEYYGFCSGHWGHYYNPPLDHNGKFVKGNGFIIDDLTDRAMKFVEQNKEKPFFCYVPYNTPHSPMQVPDRFWQKFDGMKITMRSKERNKKGDDHTRAALAMCENVDWNVGRLLAKLEELEIAENTIVIYFSDNGPNGGRWNGGMKGIKGSTDEGGVRTPFFMRWPAKIKPGAVVRPIAGTIDLLPTLADAANVPVVSEEPIDGISLTPLLDKPGMDWPDRMYFNCWKGRISVRTQQYRLDHQGRLYDMSADPGQRSDISQQLPDMTAKLRKAVGEFKKKAVKAVPNRPFTVGHRDSAITPLPARDGISHGTIERSSKPPNDSFFRNWTSTSDAITWDIEVLTAGRYEAQIYCTCRKADVGAKMQLKFGDSKTHCTITEAHDPPLVGAEHDRSERVESFVKEFKPIPMGTLDLPAQRGKLTLEAIEIPGNQAVDVRYVVLTRLSE